MTIPQRYCYTLLFCNIKGHTEKCVFPVTAFPQKVVGLYFFTFLCVRVILLRMWDSAQGPDYSHLHSVWGGDVWEQVSLRCHCYYLTHSIRYHFECAQAKQTSVLPATGDRTYVCCLLTFELIIQGVETYVQIQKAYYVHMTACSYIFQ